MQITQFAIVDDLMEDRRILKNKIASYMAEANMDYEVHEYTSAEEFLVALQAVEFDVVFMDIYMGGMTGVEAAQQLRTRDRDCKLVFLTTTEEYMRQAFSLSSSHYLSKPLKEKEFMQAMENCRVLPEHAVPVLKVISAGKSLTLDTAKMIYIDVSGHSTHIHMTNGTISINQSFSKVTAPLLQDRRFLLCMKGIMVNMDKIDDWEKDCFRMKNGQLVPVNIRGKKVLLETYQGYMMKRMRGVL